MAKGKRATPTGSVARPARKLRRPSLRLDRVLVIGLAVSFFVLPLFILPSASEYGYTKTILALVLVSILVVVWGIDGWRKKTWTVRVPWIAWPFLALVAASLFSLLGATNGRFVVQSLALLASFFVLLLLVMNAVREKRDVVLLLGSLLASATLVALYGLLQYAGVMPGPSQGTGLSQVISTLGNKEYVAGFLSYVLFPSVILIVRVRSRALRVCAIALLGFDFGSLLLFDQAGANVALMAAAAALIVGCLIFRPIEPMRRARRWLVALLLVLAFAYVVEAPSGPLNSLVGLSAEASASESEPSWIGRIWRDNSGAVRTWDWWVGIEMWKSSPWVGVGLGNYKLDFLPFKAQFLQTPRGENYGFYIPRAAQAHNEYVQVLAELGLLGALALAALLVTLAASLLHRLIRNRDESDRLDLLLCVAGLTAVLAHALVSFPAHLPASSLAAILACGIALSPAYGEHASKAISLRGPVLRIAVVALAACGSVVSVFAARDLAANVLMRDGILRLQYGRTQEARAMLERSLRLDFAPHQTHYYLAAAQTLEGDLPAALDNAERCLTRFVDESAYVLYADLAISAGKTAEARQALALLLATRPSTDLVIRARYLLAGATLREGDAESATVQLEALVREAPDFEAAHVRLGDVFTARRLRAEAEAAYVEALAVIGRKLASAEQRLATTPTMAGQERAEVRSSIDSLRKQRDVVAERLRSIRGS